MVAFELIKYWNTSRHEPIQINERSEINLWMEWVKAGSANLSGCCFAEWWMKQTTKRIGGAARQLRSNCGAASNNQFIFSSSIQSTKPKKFGLLRIEWKEKIEFDWLPGPYFHSIHWFDFIPFPFHENNQWIPFQSLHKLGYFNSTW